MITQPGIYEGLTYADYDAIPAITRRHLLPGRSWLHNREACRALLKETDSLIQGRYLHAAILEPSKVEAEFLVTEQYSKVTSEGKRRWADDETRAAGRHIIRGGEISQSVAALKTFEPCRKCLQNCSVELTLVWKVGRVLCKGRIDIWNPESRVLADIKTTEDASQKGMLKSVITYGYHYQLAFYGLGLKLNGLQPEKYQIFAVEKKSPFGCASYEIGRQSIMRCETVMIRRAMEWGECEELNRWPSYPEETQVLEVPGWAIDDGQSDLGKVQLDF